MKFDCSIHGTADGVLACPHIIDGTALIHVDGVDHGDRVSWCERCDTSDETVSFQTICPACQTLIVAALDRGEGYLGARVFDESFACSGCGATHRGLPSWVARHVRFDALRELHVAHADADTCIVGTDRFVRASLEIPIRGAIERLVFGVWSTLSPENFACFTEHPADAPRRMFSWVGTSIPGYPDTLNLKSLLFLRPGGLRPLVVLEPTSHPLAVEQSRGISIERAKDISAALLHAAGQ